MWVELQNGNYVNTVAVLHFYPVNVSGSYEVATNPSAGSNLAGISEPTAAAAQDAVRRLVHGVSATAVI